jgi:hypothetical protein
MTDTEYREYIDGRFEEMLSFYDRRAIECKRGYRMCSLYIIVASILLAPLVALDLGAWKPVLALLSTSIAAAAAVQAHYKFHDNWLLYRSTWDCLKREHALKQAGISDYRGYPDPNALFVERVEVIFQREGETWLSKHNCDDQTARQPTTARDITES